MIPIKFIISSLVTVNCKLFLSRSAHLLVCSTSNSAMSLKNISNISHSVYLMRMHVQEFSRNFLTRYIFNNNRFFQMTLFPLWVFFFFIFGFFILLFLFSWELITITTFFVVFTLIIITVWFN